MIIIHTFGHTDLTTGDPVISKNKSINENQSS